MPWIEASSIAARSPDADRVAHLLDQVGEVLARIEQPAQPVLEDEESRRGRGHKLHAAAPGFEGSVGSVKGNCWFANRGPDGTNASVTGPGVGDGNDVLPSDCGNTSAGDPVKVAYLLSCFLAREGEAPPEQCDWYTLPPKPASSAAAAKQQRFERGAREFLKTARAKQLEDRIGELTGIPDSRP